MEQAGSYGQFDLLRVFGRGQVTEVFLARERGATGPKSLLVVHRVHPAVARNAEFVHAYLNDAGVAGTIKHPNIVEIFDLGELEDTCFVAEEYVPGGSLHELLDRNGGAPLPLGDALWIVGEACAGLQFAHALAGPDGVPRNLVHGTVNPRHVLVSVDGQVKVADFGAAAALALLGVAPPGDPAQSSAYLAPEQRQGRTFDRRADIYACGALLYRLTTGALPAPTGSGTVVSPREVRPDLPDAIEKIVLKAMALNAKDRHPTCGALRRDLTAAARAAKLSGDMLTLGALVRAQFPEAVAPADDAAAPARRGDEASDMFRVQASEPVANRPAPRPFPAPDVPATPAAPDLALRAATDLPFAATVTADAPRSPARPSGDAVPVLEDADVEPLATGDFEALRTGKVDAVLPAEAAAVLARDPPANGSADDLDPPRRKRSVWIWIAAVTTIALLLLGALAVGLVYVFVVRDRLDDDGLAGLWPPALGGPTVSAGDVDPASDSTLPLGPATPPLDPAALPPSALPPAGAVPPAGSVVAGGSSIAGGDSVGGGYAAGGDAPKPPEHDGAAALVPVQPPPPVEPAPGVTPSPSAAVEPPPAAAPPPVAPAEPSPTKSAPLSSPPRSDTASPAPSKAEPASDPSPARPGAQGFVYVLTSPTSKVYMDGRLLGTTPIMNKAVPAGRHSLVLVAEGHPSHRESIHVHASKVTRVRHLFGR